MLLKRHYTRPDNWAPQRNKPDAMGKLLDPHRAPGVLLNPPLFHHLEIEHSGTKPEQHFSARLVQRGQEEGWMHIQDGKLILYAQPDNLVYDIKRAPGRYSCFDGSKLPDDEDDSGRLARAEIAAKYPGQKSPDPDNPAGYYKINYYDCVLNAEQHERFRLKKG